MPNLFSVPIFFIVFRETLEAAIVISVLFGLVDSLVKKQPESGAPSTLRTAVESDPSSSAAAAEKTNATPGDVAELNDSWTSKEKRLLRRMRIQILSGGLLGLGVALAIGIAFVIVFYTTTKDFWAKSEDLWEGIFSLLAAIIIFPVAITMLRMDRAKHVWKLKLERAFAKKSHEASGRFSKYALFILPFITVLREGLEAVIFVAGVSLGQSASSIPIAAIVGLVCGLVCGWAIYAFASRTTLSVFLVVSTNLLLLLGSGLFSKAVGDLERSKFVRMVGADVAETGDGPGSYEVSGNVWHLNCCNPENKLDGQGWTIFNAIFGWTNSATVGTIVSYVVYWLAVVVVLVYMKWAEGRTSLLGRHSAAGLKRQQRRGQGHTLPRHGSDASSTEEKTAAA